MWRTSEDLSGENKFTMANQVTMFIPEDAVQTRELVKTSTQKSSHYVCSILFRFISVIALMTSCGHIVWTAMHNNDKMEENKIILPQTSRLTQAILPPQESKLETFQFNMNQKESVEAKNIVWKGASGNFELVKPTSDGCVRTSNGGNFFGTATISFKINKSTKDVYFTISSVVKRHDGEKVFINKVSDPIPQVMNMPTGQDVQKPVTLHFYMAELSPNDEICINVNWDQVYVSYVDNFLTLMRQD